ncbi:MAG: hypothetical protein REH83_04230, partial [Rickettsiella sp.]|nr:hypothetical protein [Rickettsiella sp.]
MLFGLVLRTLFFFIPDIFLFRRLLVVAFIGFRGRPGLIALTFVFRLRGAFLIALFLVVSLLARLLGFFLVFFVVAFAGIKVLLENLQFAGIGTLKKTKHIYTKNNF